MATKLKEYYGKETAQLIANKIKNIDDSFDSNGFINFVVNNIEDKEFLARQDIFADGLEKFLGNHYQNNIELFSQILGEELSTETGMFKQGYWLWPIGRYLERHCTQDFQTSIDFIYELTKRFTGEFVMRFLLAKYPKKSVKVLIKWSVDQNVHVRRLASEAMRINLPWAKKSTVCLDQFENYQIILNNLKTDSSKFVQKSVGNNLNDLYKNTPEKAEIIINSWLKDKPTKQTLWIIKHGLRNRKTKN